MSNDSSTGGYLAPQATPPAPKPPPLEGQSLIQFLQQLVVGITGYPAPMVRPRWQPEPPNQPPFGSDWAAVGISSRTGSVHAAVIHHPDGNGYSELQRQETFTLLCSFYGPNADNFADILREGLWVSQNREILFLNAMGLIDCGDTIAVPALTNQRWVYRVDMPVRFTRQIRRYYSVLNLVSAAITIQLDQPPIAVPIPHNATEPGA